MDLFDPGSARIERDVKQRFERLAADPRGETRFAVGRASALALGYRDAELAALPEEAVEAFAGVGRPAALGEPQPGERVLDVGCGAGLDLLLAARAVGPRGRAFGVDFAPAMVARARRSIAAAHARNAAVVAGRLDALPLADASVDRLISNGAFNLCVAKERVVAEWFRVLAPGGRLQLADIVLHDDVTPQRRAELGEWSG